MTAFLLFMAGLCLAMVILLQFLRQPVRTKLEEQRGPWMFETTAGTWHYHIAMDEESDAFCGFPKKGLLKKALPLSQWGHGPDHIPMSYCKECEEAFRIWEGTDRG